MKKQFFFFLFLLTSIRVLAAPPVVLSSPDHKISVTIRLDEQGRAHYDISHLGKKVLQPSMLGLKREDADFMDGLSMEVPGKEMTVTDRYSLLHGKKKDIVYTANERTIRLKNKAGRTLDVVFRVSNDGVAFKYMLMGNDPVIRKIEKEYTAFAFDKDARAWIQPVAAAKTGWEATNPSYEEYYEQNIQAGKESPTQSGWVYPALFKSGSSWVLITEAGMDGNYCATRLVSDGKTPVYQVGFPDPREVIFGKALVPTSTLPQVSPWRIITIGSLKTITESTLGTDLAAPQKNTETDWVKPGKASWSWIISKDDSIVYNEQVRYIDLAHQMKWPYCLIDVNWDQKIGYDKMKELSKYAASKNVGLILWYNSAGDWNTVKYTPKNKLLTKEARDAEFALLHEMGVKGVKIDFFGGDGQSVIQYYIDILESAAKHQLLVNFHGATLPRGWYRTYPHLMTAEAVHGFEMVTFVQTSADKQPNHCAMLPFTRNVFDPMDFTPVNLTSYPGSSKRRTSAGFELALSVLFESGIQHYAESPAGMNAVPEYVRAFLTNLPDTWEDIRFIDGFPGEHVVLARKAGSRWYFAAINGSTSPKKITIDPKQFGAKAAYMIADGAEAGGFRESNVTGAITVELAPAGGITGFFR